MRTWRSLVATLSVLTALPTVGALGTLGATAERSERLNEDGNEYRLLDALNDRIQERFRKLDDGRFGYGRLATIRKIPHRFDAESVGETSALRDLERSQLRVVMYLAGRSVLGAGDSSIAQPFNTMSLIKGPVVVTPTVAQFAAAAGLTTIPVPLDLLDESRHAMLAFEGEVESTEFALGGWKFIARPVRASEGACINCHRGSFSAVAGNSPRIGDPLGAVLYGYQSTH